MFWGPFLAQAALDVASPEPRPVILSFSEDSTGLHQDLHGKTS